MKYMDEFELRDILDKHKMWLNGDEGSIRADLTGADLTGADLKYADLTGANLKCADLKYADLTGADLTGADLTGADLTGADLKYANLTDANLGYADLTGADLKYANLKYANLTDANLGYANLDYSAWPLWCHSLRANVDDKIAIQLLYHTLSVVQHSPYVSDELKRALLTANNIDTANRFHHVNECGMLKVYAE